MEWRKINAKCKIEGKTTFVERVGRGTESICSANGCRASARRGPMSSREPISAIAEIPSVCLLVEHEHRAGRDRKAPALPHTGIGEVARVKAGSHKEV